MANSETGMSAGNTLGGTYHVFLSFRGPDTYSGFTNSLFHAVVEAGILVFMDDEELQPGERIRGGLLQAIDDSKLYIPIFSERYASSHWCLRELAKMVENTSKSEGDGKRVILPIFYDMSPIDVKLRTDLYHKAILNLEREMKDQKNKYNAEDITKWRQALKEVGGIEGWELKNYSSHGDLITLVVNEVVINLKTRQRLVTRDLIGMEDRIAEINKLLEIDSDDVWLIGIYGMGGIGKTTLAKIIFNEQCPRFGKNCSFLDDVRETAKTNGLLELQKKLLSDISSSICTFDNIDHGINMIEATIRNKKMLIVLDDVDEANQIQNLIGEKSLCPGTRILVTTRDESILTIKGFKHKLKKYEMVRLSEEDALKLFSRHAFNDDSPPENFYTLSRRIVSTADGLPLALQAIGSSLSDEEEKQIWKERLKELKKIPHKDVLRSLKISYDALESNQKQIFLDVACFFVGENKTNPMYVWKDCGLDPESAIKVLTKRLMIKLLDDDKFGMHDQFRDLGRKIAKDEHIALLEKEDFFDEVLLTEGKRPLKALRLKSGELLEDPTIVTSEHIKRFPCIRFLWLSEVNCQGDFTGCLSMLRWISLDYGYAIPPIPAARRHQRFEATNSLHLTNVVVVNLSGVEITEDVFKSLIMGQRN